MTRLGPLLFLALMTIGQPASALAAPTLITWYGQSAFKVVTPRGKVLLIDPWINNPANPHGRQELEELKRVDLIFITHGHGDHIGDAVEIAKKTGARLVATYDLQKALVAYKGYPASQADMATSGSFGGRISLLDGEVTVQFVPAIHGDSMDTAHGPVYAGRAGGFLISIKDGPRIYHTGDTDLFSDMALLKGEVDLLLVCIGDRFTMGPERAAQAVALIRPKLAVPMHFGTFPALTGTPEQFKKALARHHLGSVMHLMRVGETLTWR